MKYKLKILFLGYNNKETKLISILEDRGCQVDHTAEKFFDTSNYDLIISFGYRYIIANEAIRDSCPIINLHISFLPFNRGSHPNFWSHFDGTPSGITIHLIDKGIDTGKYLYQKEVLFNIKKITYMESYEILVNEIENLFIYNLEEILSFEFDPKEYREKGTYHSSADLPKEVDWSRIIDDQIQSLRKDK
jgi:methionyl-tRNA formyltransferase